MMRSMLSSIHLSPFCIHHFFILSILSIHVNFPLLWRTSAGLPLAALLARGGDYFLDDVLPREVHGEQFFAPALAHAARALAVCVELVEALGDGARFGVCDESLASVLDELRRAAAVARHDDGLRREHAFQSHVAVVLVERQVADAERVRVKLDHLLFTHESFYLDPVADAVVLDERIVVRAVARGACDDCAHGRAREVHRLDEKLLTLLRFEAARIKNVVALLARA